MTNHLFPQYIQRSPSIFVSLTVALLLGVAMLQLIALAEALLAVVVQQLWAQPLVRSSPELRGLVLQLPSLGLPAILLSYVLGYVALRVARSRRLLHATVFILPVLFSAAWWSLATSGNWQSTALAAFQTGPAALSLLAMLLAVLLAWQHAGRRSAA
jgi:hypothetical protein